MSTKGINPIRFWPLVKKAPATTTTLVFIAVLFVVAYMCSYSIDYNILSSNSRPNEVSLTSKGTILHILKKKTPKGLRTPLNCSFATNVTYACPANYTVSTLIISSSNKENNSSSTRECPDYFRWIHEDLRPWMDTGITMEAVSKAQRTASFRLVVVKGKAYVDMYRDTYESRDTFTLWGILQLLRKYPGKLPDLDLMFDSKDRPVIKYSNEYQGPNATAPPPLFRYCNKGSFLDIVFPDWSFWGWPEINIKPWDTLLKDLKEGNRRTKWVKRDPYAYWKGNPNVAGIRKELMKCNVSDKQDWNARLYAQDWGKETQKGFQQSNLANQCTHRYKIYIEGSAWSVSEKYILACDSPTLMIKPKYYDFFTRSLVPMQHYWPIKYNDKCRSIKFAVDWGNNNTEKVQKIGKAASNFIQEDLRMDYVYDYMFHLLNEYAKLMKYKPTIPPKAVELCSETMACPADGLKRKFMMESMVKVPSDTSICTMLPPSDPSYLQAFFRKRTDSIKEVEMWENQFWDSQPK